MTKIIFGVIACLFTVYFSFGQLPDTVSVDQQIKRLEKLSKDARNKTEYRGVLMSVDSFYSSIEHSRDGLTADHARLNFSKASLYMRLGDLKLAEQSAHTSRLTYDSLGMQSTLDYLDILRMLGIIYIYQGDKDLALDYFIRTKDAAKEVAGPKSAFYATCLMNLGSLHWERQEFSHALEMFNKAEPLIKQNHGDDSVPYGKLLLNKGNLLKDLARYEQGEKIYTRALIILEKNLGYDHPTTLLLYNNMGTLLESQGDLQHAEYFYRKALEGRKNAFGVHHRDYLQSLGNMARVCGATGLHSKALRYYDVLLDEIEKTDQLYSIKHFGLLIDQAQVYSKMEEYDRAASVLLYVIDKFESEESQLTHSFYANALNNLGNAYINMYEYHKAKTTLEKVCALRDTSIGQGHPDYLSTAASLTKCYISLGQYDDALTLALNAELASNNINQLDENLNALYGNLAGIYLNRGALVEAIEYLNRYYTFNKNRFLKSRHYLADYELTLFVDEFKGVLSDCASQAVVYSEVQPEFISMLYEQVLLYNGFVLDVIAARNRRSLDSVALELKDELSEHQNKLLKEYLKPAHQRDQQQQIEEHIIDLEHQLNQRVEDEFHIDKYTDWRLIQGELNEDEVAVEFVRYRQFSSGISLDSFNYLALLIKSDSRFPELYYLGSESDLISIMDIGIDQSIKTATNELYQKPNENELSKLYQFIWEPLESSLRGIDKINFVPAGLLHLLNHQTIPINQQSDMIDRYELVQVGSTRNLVNRNQSNATIERACIFGGLNYDLDTTQFNSELMLANDGKSEDLSLANVEPGIRGKNDEQWNYLSATDEEINALNSILGSKGLQVDLFKEDHGTEAVFKRIETNEVDIIHLATHGYFFDDQIDQSSERRAGAMVVTSEHPMIRSGLIMSGANYAWKYGKSFNNQIDDGILTAYEISQMDLTNTSLVVLSACESGRGALSRSEGVYGLQRAFKIAGVDNIIMSLWQVPDYHTKELMIQFYENWLVDKMSIRTALSTAQKSIRDEGYEPFYWAGFVLLE